MAMTPDWTMLKRYKNEVEREKETGGTGGKII